MANIGEDIKGFFLNIDNKNEAAIRDKIKETLEEDPRVENAVITNVSIGGNVVKVEVEINLIEGSVINSRFSINNGS